MRFEPSGLRKNHNLGGEGREVTRKSTWDTINHEAQQITIRPEDRNEHGELLVYPGGPVSHLQEREWKIVRTPKFKEWFKDSKVADENGEPLVVYHGSDTEFDSFDIDKVGAASGENRDSGFFGTGHYFTAHRELAEKYGPVIYSAFLRITKPQFFEEHHSNVRNYNEATLPEDIRDEVLRRYKPLQKEEYDRMKAVEELNKGSWTFISTWDGSDHFEHILSKIIRDILIERGVDGVYGYNRVSKAYEFAVLNNDDILVAHRERTDT